MREFERTGGTHARAAEWTEMHGLPALYYSSLSHSHELVSYTQPHP